MTRDHLSQLIDQRLATLPLPAAPERLYAPIAYSLAGGGKRIRPLVVLMACELFGGKAEEAMPLAMAVEVFHNFTLLHDDIMDNAPTRRGRPAVHARWDANTAILSGDVMLIEAYKLLSECNLRRHPALLDEFNTMGIEVCEGQQLDMDFERLTRVSTDDYEQMIALKTAALLARAAVMGAMVAGAGAADRERIYRFGRELGLAFQLRDDLLDTYGAPGATGKKVGGDIVEGKKNFPAVAAMLRASDADQKALDELLHDRTMAEEERVARVLEIYNALGIRQIAEQQIERHTALALCALDELARPAAAELRALALEMVGRES